MSYEIKRSVLMGGVIDWAFYPITYKNNQYVVELRISNEYPKENRRALCYIYEYGVENKLFRKHRRKCIFEQEISGVKIDGKNSMKIEDVKKDYIERFAPEITTYIFQLYETEEQHKADVLEEITKAKNWNGVVK